MQRLWIALFTIFLCLVVAACNANSDAMSILQSTNTSAAATIAAYESQGTMTAQAPSLNDALTTAQNDLATSRAQVRDLTTRLNASAQPASISVSGGSAQNTSASSPAGTAQPAGLNFAKVSMSKSTDTDGCALNETTTFNTTDVNIYIVAEVHNYKRGTIFTANWQGDNFSRNKDNWTAPSDGTKLCIHFFISPATLNLTAGSYSATISASGQSPQTSQPVQFTLQGAAPAVTPTKSKTTTNPGG